MKNLILLFFLMFCALGFGQYNCPNEVSTDPEAPANSNLPITEDSAPNTDQRFINRFDWYRNGNIPLRSIASDISNCDD